VINKQGWIGVDLDGTLALYDGWKGIEHIGEPVPAMLERVLRWIGEGREVRIFTARCATPGAFTYVAQWLHRHGLGGLQITNIKDMHMDELWDDRCVQVEPNTGRATCPSPRGLDTP
jgi:hypothetical protein